MAKAPAPRSSDKLSMSTFKQKIGPLPLWGWGVVALIAYYVYTRYYAGGGVTTTTTDEAAFDTYSGYVPAGGYTGYGDVSGGVGGGGSEVLPAPITVPPEEIPPVELPPGGGGGGGGGGHRGHGKRACAQGYHENAAGNCVPNKGKQDGQQGGHHNGHHNGHGRSDRHHNTARVSTGKGGGGKHGGK